MLKKKFLLCFLIINLVLPLIFSVIVAVGYYKRDKASLIVSMIEKESAEEESKGEENSFEKEKDKGFSLTSYDFFNFHLSLKKASQLILNSKAISGASDLHSPPPKNS